MKFDLHKSIGVLERTPKVVAAMLEGLNEDWIMSNEGGESWSPYDIVGHFIHGEKTDWIERSKIILAQSENKTFEPFDRFAQFENSKGKTLSDLLNEFAELRSENIAELRSLQIEGQLNLKGIHPDLGEVTLENLLSTWVVHDLGHIAQLGRVMSKQYKDNVGPWLAYLPILNK